MNDPMARWPKALIVGPFVLLGLLAGFTVVVRHAEGAPLVVDLAMCGLLTALLGAFTGRPGWRERCRRWPRSSWDSPCSPRSS